MAFMLHLGVVGKYVSQIWGRTVCSRETRDLQLQDPGHKEEQEIFLPSSIDKGNSNIVFCQQSICEWFSAQVELLG